MRRWLPPACFLICLALCAPVSAQGGLLQTLYPDIARTPAPNWVSVGKRLTYYVASARVPEDRELYYRDQDGAFVDQYGNRYRKEDVTGPGGGGQAYLQVDVESLEPGRVVLRTRLFSILTLYGRQPMLSVSDRSSIIGLPGVVDEIWANPQYLARIPESYQPPLRVVRMPYTLGQKTYNSIRFHSQQEKSSYTQVYDLETGVLLYCGGTSAVRPQGAVTGDLKPGTTGMLTHVQLVSIRDVSFPWSNATPPAWLKTVQQFQYDGYVGHMVPNSPVFTFPASQVLSVVDRGSHWIRANEVSTMYGSSGLPPQTDRKVTISGKHHVGGVWLPPSVLTTLRVDQVLDSDPATGCQTRVCFNGPLPDGRRVTGISEITSSFGYEYYYLQDSGMLVSTRCWYNTTPGMTYVSELHLKGYQ